MFTQIIRIIKDGFISLFYDIDGNKRATIKICLFFIVVPIIVSIYVKGKNLKGTIDTLLTCLSIFTTLTFSILFTVPDKLSQRIKDLQDKKDEGTHNYLIRFLNFSRSFVKQVAFIIVLCLILIILLIIQKIDGNIFIIIINSILFTILIMYIFTILSNIYILLIDDIDKSSHDIK